MKVLQQGIKKLIRRKANWAIGIYVGDSPVDLQPPIDLHNPVLTAQQVTDIPADFVADPFMLFTGGYWYLFFEVLNAARNKGEIGLAISSDGYRWQYQQIVLREAFHLSYPYVFQVGNDYFMIPETYQDQSVRLYQATQFPYEWSLVKHLLQGQDYVDASIIHFQNYWWLFSTRPSSDALYLHFAPELTGDWIEHPQSPVISGNKQIARPGGRVILHQNSQGQKLLRYAQDDATLYGRQVYAFEIMELTPTGYREQAAVSTPILHPSGSGWNAIGMHHIDPHPLAENRWLACVDGYYQSYVWKWGNG